MNKKLLYCLPLCLFINGSFAPIGKGEPSKQVQQPISYDERYDQVKDSITYQVAVLQDLTRHEVELRLDLHRSKITRDSLVRIAKNIEP